MENILFPNMEIACPVDEVVVHFPLVLGISVWNSVKCLFQMLIFKSNWVLPLGKMTTQFFSFSAHFFSHLTRLSSEIPRLTFFSSYLIQWGASMTKSFWYFSKIYKNVLSGFVCAIWCSRQSIFSILVSSHSNSCSDIF